MRLTILTSLTLVVLIAAVNGNTVLGKIKEKLTPSSSHHDEHEEDNKSVLPDRKQISERLRPSPPSLDEEHRLSEEHHEREHGRDESSFLPPPSLKSGESIVGENKDKRETEEHELPISSDRQRIGGDELNPLKTEDEKILEMQNPSDVHHDQKSENLQEESKRVDPSSDQQTSEAHYSQGFGRPYYGGYRQYGYGYPYYRTYSYYPGYYQSYYPGYYPSYYY